MIFRLIVLVSLLSLSSASASDGVVAKLSLPNETVIAGMPFEIEVRLSNPSSNPVRVGLVAQLVLVLEDGTEIPFQNTDVLEPWTSASPDTSIELGPGESAIRTLGWLPWMPNWASEYRISAPGTHQLLMQLRPGIWDEPGCIPIIRTNTVNLTRARGSDLDRELWRKMEKAAGGRWPNNGFLSVAGGQQLMDEIVKSHPTSAYFPYALTLTLHSMTLDAAPDMEQLMVYANSPAYPQLLKAAGDTSLRLATLSKRRGDILSAAEAYRQADAFYKAAARTGSTSVREAIGQNHREVQRNHPK